MSVYLDACLGKPTPYTAIWLNRQAGRYMPEYHRLKGSTPSLDFFKTPDLAAQAALDAQRILGVDAAILFADLLPIVEPMGFKLDYLPEIGPVIENSIQTESDVERIPSVCADESFQYIATTIRFIKADLPAEIPLIGFAGAPFTLASYLLEGGSSKQFSHTKKFMYNNSGSWNELLAKLTDTLVDYLDLQISAGADSVQLFDSWVGCLSVADYRRYVFPFVKRLINSIPRSVPVIYFGTGNSHLCEDMARTGASVLALDWRTPLWDTWERTKVGAIQGNLDPAVLLSEPRIIKRETDRILQEIGYSDGHIFNLGHGILPSTPVDHVKYLVDYVHEASHLIRSSDNDEFS